jgi:hypothetical protein
MMGYLLFGCLVFFLIGYYKLQDNFWVGQICLAISAFCFFVIVIKYLPTKEDNNGLHKS